MSDPHPRTRPPTPAAGGAARGPGAPSALPVAVDTADAALAAEVAAHVESVLGWQVVEPGPHLPARLVLGDAVHPTTPTVVVAWSPDAAAVRTAMRDGALDVLSWPDDAVRLAALVPGAAGPAPADRVVVVGASGRGVGATTVALGLAGLLAWGGQRVAVRTDAEGVRLAGADRRDPAVAGVPGLAVHADLAGVAAGSRPGVLVADVGRRRVGQVLVGRGDRALAAALAAHAGGGGPLAVVTVGEGSLRRGELARLVGGRCHVALPWSFRVGRAGLRGQVPVGLPGAWLAALRPVADAVLPAAEVAA